MPQVVAMYADMFCPFAYLTAWRLRTLREQLAGKVVIAHKSLALEYVNREPTAKPTIDLEAPLLMAEEPDLPWRMWDRPDSQWPVTAWPAFEAVKCAEQQSLELADELDWLLRHAFFAESRCIALRHEILACAEAAGLEMACFTHDFDSGVVKGQVIAEAREGWERLQVNGSPTLVFPNGTQAHGQELGLPEMTISENRVLAFTPGARDGISGSEALARTLERRLAS